MSSVKQEATTPGAGGTIPTFHDLVQPLPVCWPLAAVITNCPHPGRVLPYLGMVERFYGDDPHFGDLGFNLVPITLHCRAS